MAWELEKAQQELKDKRIILKKAGSIAEAAVGLNKIFEAADEAAKQYLESVRQMADEGELKDE